MSLYIRVCKLYTADPVIEKNWKKFVGLLSCLHEYNVAIHAPFWGGRAWGPSNWPLTWHQQTT